MRFQVLLFLPAALALSGCEGAGGESFADPLARKLSLQISPIDSEWSADQGMLGLPYRVVTNDAPVQVELLIDGVVVQTREIVTEEHNGSFDVEVPAEETVINVMVRATSDSGLVREWSQEVQIDEPNLTAFITLNVLSGLSEGMETLGGLNISYEVFTDEPPATVELLVDGAHLSDGSLAPDPGGGADRFRGSVSGFIEEEGTYQVTVRAVSLNGLVDSVTFTVIVDDAIAPHV